MKKVLFVCVYNSVRSQMSEGFLRHLYGNEYEAYSAGVYPSVVNPYTIQVMKEIGIDISSHRSKSIDEYKDKHFDYIITVCDKAKNACPVFHNGTHILHKNFTDPNEFVGSEEDKLNEFRKTRDEIRNWIQLQFAPDSMLRSVR